MTFLNKLESSATNGLIPHKLANVLAKFYPSYASAIGKNGFNIVDYDPLLCEFLDKVIQQLAYPHHFDPFHQAIRTPFDYYQFGIDFFRPLIIFKKSQTKGLEQVDIMIQQLKQGDNVILLANHQTEPDPQAISLLLQDYAPEFAEKMIIVAGHRVINDPLAVPFSLGRNLLCIFSKKYIETPIEKKEEKLQHNQKTMKQMSQLLSEGGKCIYVAPSGGRDRPGLTGQIEVARFDPKSLEMFWLMAQQAEKTTHFYPLTLVTYALLPPPNSLEKELGEKRQTQCTPIHLKFGSEIDMNNFPGSETKDKKQKRRIRADYIWDLVRNDYQELTEGERA
jgi:glycerol-3-phosphate O-acyltransferase